MGIEFSRSYKTSGGQCFATLEEAQISEITQIIGAMASEKGAVRLGVGEVSQCIVENKAAIVNVLSTTDKSRPKVRVANGRLPKSHKSKQKLEPIITDEERERLIKNGTIAP